MNPSSWNQRFWIAVIALIATFIALFLGAYQWKIIDSIWDPFFDRGTIQVLTSDLSHKFTRWIRIPDAILGAVAYWSDAVFALAGSKRRWQDRPWLVMIFSINVIPIGLVSFTLVILQGVIVKFWCTLCLTTATISLILILLAYNEVLSSLIYLYEVKKRGGWKIFWRAFWGIPSQEAIDAGIATLQKRYKNVGKNR